MAMKMAMPQSLQDLEAKDPKNGLPMGHAKNKTGLGEKACFSNDKGLGSAFPDVSQAVLLKGEAPDFDAGPVVLLFWAKYAKGDYRTMVHFSYLVRTIPGLQVYGISCDAEEADATAMLKKMGTAMPTQSLDELLFDYTLAYDAGSAVKKSIMETCGLNTIAPGFAFLYDKSKNMVWKEVFTSSWALKQGQFAESCALCVEIGRAHV